MYLRLQIGQWELRARLTRDPALIAQDDNPTEPTTEAAPHVADGPATTAELAPDHHEPALHSERRYTVDDDEHDDEHARIPGWRVRPPALPGPLAHYVIGRDGTMLTTVGAQALGFNTSAAERLNRACRDALRGMGSTPRKAGF